MGREWYDKILNVNEQGFEALALEIFKFQYDNNPVYNEYLRLLRITPATVKSLDAIPFLPIRFFQSHVVKATNFNPEFIFESSGTTGSIPSRHYIRDLRLYEESFLKCFDSFYGNARDYCILGLLPSYLERKNSSLVYMTGKLIERSGHQQSGFYLNEQEKLLSVLKELNDRAQACLLIGVSFALVDLATMIDQQKELNQASFNFRHTVIMETGGMKGRRKEMVRPELHSLLERAFDQSHIHSEYGMTELLSQAYAKTDGIFECPSWMKVMIRHEDDPLTNTSMIGGNGMAARSGPMNIIDLANLYSCSFIATDDIAKLTPDGKFEVLGRLDRSDLRGCSLMTV